MNEETDTKTPAATIVNNLPSVSTKATFISSPSAASIAASIAAYRASSERWINEIKLMIIDGNSKQAREEYMRLEKQFPEDAINFRPDFNQCAVQPKRVDEGDELQGN